MRISAIKKDLILLQERFSIFLKKYGKKEATVEDDNKEEVESMAKVSVRDGNPLND